MCYIDRDVVFFYETCFIFLRQVGQEKFENLTKYLIHVA